MKKHPDHLSLHGIEIYSAEHPDIIALGSSIDDPSIHGDKVWEASYVMMDFLNQFPLESSTRILEVGCGWGVLSCYLAHHFQARVTGLDADEAVKPYFEFHAKKNQVTPTFLHSTMNAMTIDKLSQYDVIIGCDICFWDSLKQEWQNLIQRAFQAGVKEVYITDPGRPPFWDLEEYCEKPFGAQIWSHDTDIPYEIEEYILEIHNPGLTK